ncbi:MAG: alanyl-tRNA editing protein [Rhodospirillales bacterium]|nr:alanyl-tRNA editing protein [Rhodospirillales bacterium]
MTEQLFRDDSYLKSCEARVVSVDDAGVELDRTVFYAVGGGQLGDSGLLRRADGTDIEIVDTQKDPATGRYCHKTNGAADLAVGDPVTALIDWDRRHRLMRMHTACHLLCAAIDGGVTGGSVGPDKSRLDFDLQDTALDKEAIQAQLNRLVDEDHELEILWITDEEMAANADLVRTMSVKPPTGSGRVRLMKIGDNVDLQPCGGTHVKRTGEIGRLEVGKIENKGKHNRRVNIRLAAG